jgi:hypothetical protein
LEESWPVDTAQRATIVRNIESAFFMLSVRTRGVESSFDREDRSCQPSFYLGHQFSLKRFLHG